MEFNARKFCPNIVDKSTPLKKFLYCNKNKGLCKMVTYFPNGQLIPKADVKKLGCPYGYVIQDIVEKNQVTQESNVLDDISKQEKKETESPKQAKKNNQKKPRKNKSYSKKNTKKKA